jgi:transposase
MSRVRVVPPGRIPLVTIPPVAGHLEYEVVMPTETDKKSAPTRRRGRHPKTLRRDAAAPVIDQYRTIAGAARDLGVVEQTLGNWMRQERIDRGEHEGKTIEVRAENARLRWEAKRLTMERNLLKRSVWPSG